MNLKSFVTKIKNNKKRILIEIINIQILFLNLVLLIKNNKNVIYNKIIKEKL